MAASTLTAGPVFNPDGQPVTGPAIGAIITGNVGNSYRVCGNDNPAPGGDNDYNEPCAFYNFLGGNVLNVVYQDSNSALLNYLGVLGQVGQVGPGGFPFAAFTYTAGTETIATYKIQGNATVYQSGPGSRNPDGYARVYAECVQGTCLQGGPSGVPEPSTWVMSALGLAGVTIGGRKRLFSRG